MDSSSTNKDDLIVLVVEDEEIKVSKAFLTENSEYFRAMFEVPLKESTLKRVVLDESFGVLKAVLNFDFDKQMDSTDALDLIDTFIIADKYRFEKVTQYLKTQRERFLQFHVRNAWHIYSRKEELELIQMDFVVEEVVNYIDFNCSKLIEDESFFEVPKYIVSTFLQRDTFMVNEEALLLSVLNYMKMNEKSDDLLQFIRYDLIANDKLEQMIEECSKIKDFLEFRTTDMQKSMVRHCAVKNVNLSEPSFGLTVGFLSTICRKVQTNKRIKTKYDNNRCSACVEFNLEFHFPVTINYMKIKLTKMSENTHSRIVLQVSKDGFNWDDIYNAMKTNHTTNVVYGHEFRFEKKIVKQIKLQVYPSEFGIQYFVAMLREMKYPIGYSTFLDRYDDDFGDPDNWDPDNYYNWYYAYQSIF